MLPLSIFSVNLLSDNLLLLAAALFFVAILISKLGAKIGVPALLLFLILGMVAGADGIGVKLEDYELAESIGHFAMSIILFYGGLQTSLKETRPVMRQGIMLSTIGVLLTVLITGSFIYFVYHTKIGPVEGSVMWCFLLAAVMASTDSASVFSVLKQKKLNLRENIGPLLELESGSNDPMAYILTIILVQLITGADRIAGIWGTIGTGAYVFVLQLVVGVAIGLAVGFAGAWFIGKIKLPGSALYSILIMSIGFLADGLASILFGNGLLALYIAAIIISNKSSIPYRKDILKFFDGMTWLMQLIMFLILGLISRPLQMGHSFGNAIVIVLFMLFVARPVSVFLTLAPFRGTSFRAKLFISWVGLKGAGPILFALCPVVAGLQGGTDIFNIVFCITLLSLVIQGSTLPFVARLLKLSYDQDPEVETFGLELPDEMGILRDHVVTEEDFSEGDTMRDLHLPHGIRVVMVRRDEKFLVPHGSMQLLPGDHLLIIMGDSDD